MRTQGRKVRASLTDQRGQVVVLFLVTLPVLLAAVGLLVDGGRLLIEYKRAQVAIDGAAFAAAQRVDRAQFFNNQVIVLDAQEAASIGGLYGSLNSRGSVRVTSIEVFDNIVIARGYASIEPIFLKMFGIGTVHLSLVSRATPIYGISRPGQ